MFGTVICDSQKVETVLVSINSWMGKQTWYVHNMEKCLIVKRNKHGYV